MVRVSKDYVIEIDSLNYTVKRDTHRKTIKKDIVTGKEIETDLFTTVGYFSDLTGAIKGVIHDMNSRALSDGVHTLEEALKTVIENNRTFSELLEKALEL